MHFFLTLLLTLLVFNGRVFLNAQSNTSSDSESLFNTTTVDGLETEDVENQAAWVKELSQTIEHDDVSVKTSISTNTILLGKPFSYTIKVTYKERSKPILPAPAYNFSPLELTGYKIFPLQTHNNGSITFTIEYFLTTFALQTKNTPAFYLQLKATEELKMAAKPFLLNVKNQLLPNEINTKAMQPFANSIVYKNKLTISQIMFILLVFTICITTAVLIFILLRTPKKSIVNAYVQLENDLLNLDIASCKSMEETSASQKKLLRELYFKLSQYSKQFLALRCNDQSAVGATPKELKKSSALFFTSKQEENTFISFFRDGEKIKFSKTVIDLKKTENQITSFYSLIVKKVGNMKMLETARAKGKPLSRIIFESLKNLKLTSKTKSKLSTEK